MVEKGDPNACTDREQGFRYMLVISYYIKYAQLQ